jgi:hypothetical protein
MIHAPANLLTRRSALLALLAFCAGGCGRSSTTTDPGPLKQRDDVAAALPSGITLDSPVVPDKLYGESSKTVEDALRYLQAYARDRVLYDGGMGHEIRFDPDPGGAPKKTARKSKSQPVYLIIKLAK